MESKVKEARVRLIIARISHRLARKEEELGDTQGLHRCNRIRSSEHRGVLHSIIRMLEVGITHGITIMMRTVRQSSLGVMAVD